MDETFVIVGPDGTEHEFPVGMDPKRAAAIVRGEGQAKPTQSPVPENPGILGSIKHAFATADPMGRGVVPEMSGNPQVAQQQAADTMESWARQVGPAVVLSGVGMAAPAVPGLMGKALGFGAKVMNDPLGAMAVGATTGGMANGMSGAISGGMAGLLGGRRIGRELGRLSTKVTPAAKAAPQVAKAAAPAARMTPQQMLAQEIDYRLTDAVPIDAITRDISRKGGSILEAGESIPGLADRVAQATKAAKASGNWDEVERLGRALRQRMHITAKSSR